MITEKKSTTEKGLPPTKEWRIGSFLLSSVIHVLLFYFLVTTTLDLTLPEGNVSITVIDNRATPKGAQVDTPIVAPERTESSPELHKKATPSVPKSAPEETSQLPKRFQTTDDSTVPVPVVKEETKLPPKNEEPPKAVQKTLPAKSTPVTESETVNNLKAVEEAPEPQPEAPEELASAGKNETESTAQEPQQAAEFGTTTGVKAHAELRSLPGNVKPKYPLMARLRRLEGEVSLLYHVKSDGTVENIQVLGSRGVSSFVDAAVSAMKNWRYFPGQEGQVSFRIIFSLKGEAEQMPSRLRRK